MVTYGAVKGAPKGAFILTLDSPVSHFTIELGTKRNAVQLSFVPSWSDFRSFSSLLVGIHTPPHRSGILHDHLFVSVTEHSGFASNQVLLETLATPPHHCHASIRTLNGPLQGPVHVGVRSKYPGPSLP